jgi:hypothetical protein
VPFRITWAPFASTVDAVRVKRRAPPEYLLDLTLDLDWCDLRLQTDQVVNPLTPLIRRTALSAVSRW